MSACFLWFVANGMSAGRLEICICLIKNLIWRCIFLPCSGQFGNPASRIGVIPLDDRGRSWIVGELDWSKNGVFSVGELPAE